MKPEQKRLIRSVQTVSNQIKTPIILAFETGSRAQAALQMREPQRSVIDRLDRCAKRRQHKSVGSLLGECRI